MGEKEIAEKVALMKRPFAQIAESPQAAAILKESQELKKIDGPVAHERLVSLGNGLASILSAIEKARVVVVTPLHQAKVKLDGEAKVLSSPFAQEKQRLDFMNVAYNQEQDRIKRAKEEEIRRKQAELERKAREEREKADREAAEKAKKEPPAAAQASTAVQDSEDFGVPIPGIAGQLPLTAAPTARAETPAEEKIRKEQEELQFRQQQLAQQGTAGVKKKWVFEVTDAAKVPADYLSPDPVKIRIAVDEGLRFIPGVNIHEEMKSGFRAPSARRNP